MANDKDYYDVLGVEPDADPTIIKRRYRLLVREYHPDIAVNREEAHEKMLAINEAWTVLSDPSGRARYDRSRAPVVVPRPQTPADYPQHATGSATGRSGGSGRPGSPSTSSAPRTARTARSASARGTNTRTRMLTMVFQAAELYFFQGRADEAIGICNQVIKIDPSNAEAPALLGDIYAEQGRTDVAITMYERAVLNQPQNMLYRQKLVALGGDADKISPAPAGAVPPTSAAGGGAGKYSRSGIDRSKRNVATPRQPGTRMAPGTRTSLGARNAMASHPSAQGKNLHSHMKAQAEARTKVAIVLLCMAFGLVMWGNFGAPDHATPLPFLPQSGVLSGALVATTAIGALLIGMALPLIGIISRCGQRSPGAPVWEGWPLLGLILLTGVVYFPITLFILVISAAIRGEINRSYLIVLLATLCWSSTLALAVPDNQTLPLLLDVVQIWAGRLILPLMVLGWALGSQGSKR
jgi:curved DNA-binding protein CbpA